MVNYWLRLFSFFSALLISSALYAETSLRIGIQQLHSQLNQPNLVIIDTRSKASYDQEHIPGALNFPEPLTYADKSLDGRIIQPGKMQQVARKLGLETNKSIIVYDNGGLIAAARVFWSLEVYGFNNVKILDQGFEGWLHHNLKTSQKPASPKPSNYIATINHNRIATKLKTQIATKIPQQTIIDARPYQAYIGKKSSAKRFGHIPSAFNIPANHNLQNNDNLKSLQPIDELKKLYSNIPKNHKVVLYCAIGRISTTNYLVLRELGYDVSNYDASWKEWANDFSLPIEK